MNTAIVFNCRFWNPTLARNLPFKVRQTKPATDKIEADGITIELPNYPITVQESLDYNRVISDIQAQREGTEYSPALIAKMQIALATIALRRLVPEWTEANTMESWENEEGKQVSSWAIVEKLSDWITALRNKNATAPDAEGFTKKESA